MHLRTLYSKCCDQSEQSHKTSFEKVERTEAAKNEELEYCKAIEEAYEAEEKKTPFFKKFQRKGYRRRSRAICVDNGNDVGDSMSRKFCYKTAVASTFHSAHLFSINIVSIL